MKERLTFSGHATVVIDSGGRRVVTDPILGRHVQHFLRARQGVSASELAGVDAVLISHLHHDHLDFGSLRRLGRDTLVICPAGSEALFERKGFSNVVPLASGESTGVGDLEVRAVQAAHDPDRTFSKIKADPLGFVLEGGCRVYFAGDTDMFEGMDRIGDGVDVALIPIWGWGPKLGDGHLSPESAAEAVARLSPRVVVPIHWGSLSPIGTKVLWPWMLKEPPKRFLAAMAEHAPDVDVRVLHPGESLDLEGAVA